MPVWPTIPTIPTITAHAARSGLIEVILPGGASVWPTDVSMSTRSAGCSPRYAGDHAGLHACLAGLRPDRHAQRHRRAGDAGSTGSQREPLDGAFFAFRGRRGGMVKLLWYDGQVMCLFSKRLERARFVWPVTETGRVSLTPAQLSMLLDGIDWRMARRERHPDLAG